MSMSVSHSDVWVCGLQMTTFKDETGHCALGGDAFRGLKVPAPPTHSLVSEKMLQ